MMHKKAPPAARYFLASNYLFTAATHPENKPAVKEAIHNSVAADILPAFHSAIKKTAASVPIFKSTLLYTFPCPKGEKLLSTNCRTVAVQTVELNNHTQYQHHFYK